MGKLKKSQIFIKLKNAVEAVNDGMTYRGAEEKFGIAKSTISDATKRLKQTGSIKISAPQGRPKIFTQKCVRIVIEHAKILQDRGAPLYKAQFPKLIREVAKLEGVLEEFAEADRDAFPNNMFMSRFFEENKKEITAHAPQFLNSAQASATNEEIGDVLEKGRKYLHRHSLSNMLKYPELMATLDEFRVSIKGKGKHKSIMLRKGSRNSHVHQNANDKNAMTFTLIGRPGNKITIAF
jgi:hypothetical protein